MLLRKLQIGIYFISAINTINAQLLEGLYCGKDNCYNILDVNRQSSRNEISRNYRQLAKKFHPDLHRGEKAKKEAEDKFKLIATAYEILKDEDTRADYDYMLDHPDEYYANYYRYYRRQVAPKIDVRLVLAVSITIVSIIQYYSAWQRYETAINYFISLPKYKNRAIDIATQEGLLLNKHSKKKSKYEQKEEINIIIRRVIEEKMDIRGSYAKPNLKDILWVQLIMLPYTICMYLVWYFNWIWKFHILQHEYEEEHKLYLIRKFLKLGENQFAAIDEEKKNEYLRKELWIKNNFIQWQKEEEENMKKSLAENSRYKAYRRYMKNHGSGRITFDDS